LAALRNLKETNFVEGQKPQSGPQRTENSGKNEKIVSISPGNGKKKIGEKDFLGFLKRQGEAEGKRTSHVRKTLSLRRGVKE